MPTHGLAEESKTGALLAEILESGGSIGGTALAKLVKRLGYDPRTVGTLHGRRLALLRRDPRTGRSILTTRGRELAEQHIFARRLSGQ
jgi:hypothetical protein